MLSERTLRTTGAALEDVAAECDAVSKAARERLVEAVREASRASMTQREIAERIGRSQPEVSRLLRFHGTGPLARVLRRHRSDVLRLIADAGGSNVRVFGSDIDLLFTMGRVMTLLELAGLEIALEDLLGVEVDLVPESILRPGLGDRVLRDAVPL